MSREIEANDAPSGSEAQHQEGTVVRSTGSWYDVQVENRIVQCKIRGKFRLAEEDVTNPVAVGDRVTLRTVEDGTGLITDIHERRNRLSRRAAGRRVGMEHIIASNIDRAWLVQSIRMPKINVGMIDRFLVMAESNDIPAGIIFNKKDLMKGSDRQVVMELRDLYANLGYPLLMTSIVTRECIDDLQEWLAGNINVVTGPSGVGKSSLLNAVEPGLGIATGEVSERTNKGKHTTTYAALYPLSAGGYVVDTPGIREFGIIDLEPEELSYYFVEFRPYLPECRFLNCTHDHEPGCAVQAAVEEGEISDIRYYSYLNILESVRAGERDVGR